MKIRPAIAALQHYHPPLESRAERDYVLLDFNESTRSPQSAVNQAIWDALSNHQLRKYPSYRGLAEKIAHYASVQTDQIAVTNGSDSALSLIMQTMLETGSEMIMVQPGFIVIENLAQATGAHVIKVPFLNMEQGEFNFPLEQIIAAITPNTRLISVISPNNPTGSMASLADIETLLRLDPNIGVLVDEAYHEFCGVTAAPLLGKYDNLVITRTFSKALAIAGLRLGYAIAHPEFIQALLSVRIPYDVNALAVSAAHVLLDKPQPWQDYITEIMQQAKPLVESFFQAHDVWHSHSHANFMLVKDANVESAFNHLERAGILVRPQRAPIQNMFRMSVGTVAEMHHFIDVYQDYLAQNGQS